MDGPPGVIAILLALMSEGSPEPDTAPRRINVGEVPSADSSFHVVDFKRNGKSVSVEPTLLKISDELSLLYGKSANSPPLVLLHTIRTQLEYFQALAP